MNPYILILADFGFRIPQRITASETINVAVLCNELRQNGLSPVISHYEDRGLFNLVRDLHLRWCLPATSYYQGYRHLVNSVLPVLQGTGVRLVPSAEHVLAYENKSMQVAVANALNLPMPVSYAVATAEEFSRAAEAVGYPFVLKAPEGFASTSVSLIQCREEMEAIVGSHFTQRALGTKGIGMAIVQQFLPGLKGDWKIIVVGRAIASLYRRVKPGDFRASGSGLFEFRIAPPALLDFADSIRRRLGAPWISCDVAETEHGPMLIEYQVVHFGTTTTDKAPSHCKRNAKGEWTALRGPVSMEREMALAVMEILDERPFLQAASEPNKDRAAL